MNSKENHIQLEVEFGFIEIEAGDEEISIVPKEKLDPETISELEVLTGKTVNVHEPDPERVDRVLSRSYRSYSTILNLDENAGFNPVTQLVQEAEKLQASDIHIEPNIDHTLIRMRIDGKLLPRHRINTEDHQLLINKFKILASLDITRKRIPQDGRISMVEYGSKLDLRLSTIPSIYGEKLVIRLLGKELKGFSFSGLGMSKLEEGLFKSGLGNNHGLILVTGPTGSGKSTTLSLALKHLNQPDVNIISVEDPVEYTVPGIFQVQVNESLGLGFSSALRSFLRQDPDVIMVGEIRDTETANLSIRAALTGHLVLSTLHTNSAWAAVDRLVDLEIPRFLLSSTIKLLVAQRLIRKLCDSCKERSLNHELGIWVYTPKGCPKCYQRGFLGRVAIFEMIPVNGKISEKIKAAISILTKKDREGYPTLKDQAFSLLKEGKTSHQEVLSILSYE